MMKNDLKNPYFFHKSNKKGTGTQKQPISYTKTVLVINYQIYKNKLF